MARQLIPVDTCDLCKRQGLPDSEADRSVHMAIDGPPKRYELCPPHVAQLSPFMELCMDDEYGVDESLKPKKRGQPKPETPDQTQPELMAPEQDQQPELPVSEPEQEPEKEPSKYKKDLWLVCPLPHTSKKGAVKRVRYSGRNSHADMSHNLRLWDIEWQDPDGILKVPCTVHAECLKHGLSFTNAMGLKSHINSSPLDKLPEGN